MDGSPNLGAIRLCHVETPNLADARGSLDVYIHIIYIYIIIFTELYVSICYIHLYIYIHSSSCAFTHDKIASLTRKLVHVKIAELVFENRPVAVVAESM